MSRDDSRPMRLASLASHARMRLYQRYGILATDADLAAWSARIEAAGDDVRVVKTQPNGRVWAAVATDAGWVLVVWHPGFRAIVTALGPHLLPPGLPMLEAAATGDGRDMPGANYPT